MEVAPQPTVAIVLGPGMDWIIINSRGSRIRAFTDEATARTALRELSAETDQRLYLMAYDDDGELVGETMTVSDLDLVVADEDGPRDDHVVVRNVRVPNGVISVSGGDRTPA